MGGSGVAWRRVVLAMAGMLGAIGVMAAAGASHGGEQRNLSAIAAMGLAHGPALLAIGTAIFVGDLAVREWVGRGLFPGAAPLGGVGMIGGWLAVVVAALVWRPDLSDSKN